MLQVVFRIPIITQQTPDGIPVYGFGLMLFCAFFLCTWLARSRAPREGIAPYTVDDIAIWILLGGLLGARLTSMFTTGHYPPLTSLTGLREWLYKLVAIWDGGIVLYGAILGGLASFYLCYFLYYRSDLAKGKPGLPVRRFIDVIAPAVALGLVLGRLGCFFNGCCYGQVAPADCVSCVPVGFPLCAPAREITVGNGYQTVAGFTIDPRPFVKGVVVGKVDPGSPAHVQGLREGAVIVGVNGKAVSGPSDLDQSLGSLQHWPRGQTLLELELQPEPGQPTETLRLYPYTIGLYPTQLYEVVSMFLLLLVLLAYTPLRHNPGQVTAVLMFCYGIHRYLNELLRDDPRPKGLESYGSVILIVGGLILWAWLQNRPADPGIEQPWKPEAPGGEKPQPQAGPVHEHVTN